MAVFKTQEMHLKDSNKYKSLRHNLVEKLSREGIDNLEVLEAINRVPRQDFMVGRFIDFAYSNRAYPIDEGQTVSQPYTVAFQTQLLDIQKDEKVLEVGTGSGYQCAVLLEVGAEVYTIERNMKLFEKARDLLQKLGYKPHCFLGDGYEGLPAHGPFDKIIITASAPEIPPKLLEQLKIGGKLVVPVGNRPTQEMTLVEKVASQDYIQTTHGNFIFVPLIKGKE